MIQTIDCPMPKKKSTSDSVPSVEAPASGLDAGASAGELIKRPPGNTAHIVSSDHLASPEAWQLSELEYAMTMSYNAFTRWMTHCMAAAGQRDLSPLDILILHNVNHRAREKRLSDIVFTLNIDDSHTVNYSLKKLMKAKLVESKKNGKEIFYKTTDDGEKLCQTYRDVRQACLVDAATATNQNFDEASHCALLLRSMSGLYDQASRAASSM